ncbi:MAG: MFS transporter [Bacteroidales bacterium]|nr:MFS transporter [Bacteroidales bacterium]
MSRFLDPPAAREQLPKEKIDKTYKSMRIKVFAGAFLGYAGYYLVRKNLALAAPDMVNEGIINNATAGIAMSAISIAYAFSKFIMGTVSDRSDARKFLCIGLVLSALTMIAVGIFPFTTSIAANTAIIFALMLVVGWLSGMGWPPCGRIMAHWFSQNERSFMMSMWNTSHTIGSGSLGMLAMWGVAVFGTMGIAQTWRADFIVPSLVAILIALFCWWALRDTPESCGLPSVADWRNDHSGVKSKGAAGEKLPFKTLFVDHVLKNRLLWVIAISNVLVYMVRYGISDWSPSYLQTSGIMDKAECKVAFSVHNYVGAIGTIFMGWVSAKFFKGRCAMPNVICMVMVLVGTLLYWQAPLMGEALGISPKIFVYTALIIIGFFIYGPVALIGVQALNTVPKNAAGTAAGFVGLFGYLLGDSLLSKIVIGAVTKSGSVEAWSMANFIFVIASLVGIILCAVLIPSEKKALE